VDFRKPGSIPLKTVGARSQSHALGKRKLKRDCLTVSDLTRSAGIQLNDRVSLRRADEILSSAAIVLDLADAATIRPCIPRDQGSSLPSLGGRPRPTLDCQSTIFRAGEIDSTKKRE
jgi:hypothetical protein